MGPAPSRPKAELESLMRGALMEVLGPWLKGAASPPATLCDALRPRLRFGVGRRTFEELRAAYLMRRCRDKTHAGPHLNGWHVLIRVSPPGEPMLDTFWRVVLLPRAPEDFIVVTRPASGEETP